MSRTLAFVEVVAVRFPRVSGDEPTTIFVGLIRFEFSPRERG